MTKQEKSAEAPLLPDDSRFGRIHSKRQANKTVRIIRVEAWDTDDEECNLYAYPLTMNDVIGLEAFGTASEQNIMQIIRQCMDGQGKPYFTLIDKPALLNEPADVIGDILIKLNGSTSSFDQELKKNNK